MIKKAIRNFQSLSPNPPRLCDLVVDEENTASLQFKRGGRVESIPVSDFLHQLGDAAKPAP